MPHHLNSSRLEAFSDGVIGVILTIMVLELKVPAKTNGLHALHAVLPVLLVYLLSYLQTGIYWVNHHYLIDEVTTVSHGLLWANLLFLFCLSLIPFATFWVREWELSPFSISLYAATCLLPAISYTLLWRVVRLNSKTMPHASLGKQALSMALYASAIVAGLYAPYIALACIGVVAILWILPPRHPRVDVHEHTDVPAKRTAR